MTEYRRFYLPNAMWFFTVNLAQRKNNRLLVDKIDALSVASYSSPYRMAIKSFTSYN